jgi:uncharacterized LabA/DUF88 family protein
VTGNFAFIDGNEKLYEYLQKSGYILVFKPTITDHTGSIKGNCDAELVLQVMIDLNEFEKAVIVTGDGDFTCLVRYLQKQNKLSKSIRIPHLKIINFPHL